MGTACSCSKAVKARSPEEELTSFHSFTAEHLIKKHSHHGLKDAFTSLGGGDDDKVTREEMIKNLTGWDPPYPGNAEMLFDLLDTDNEGFINKTEFVNSTKKDYLATGPLRDFTRFVNVQFGSVDEAFKAADGGSDDKKEKSNDAKLSSAEFCTMLGKMNYKGDASIIYKLIDANGDESVTVNEFKAKVKSKKK